MKKLLLCFVLVFGMLLFSQSSNAQTSNSLPITVSDAEVGAPVKFGIPFPKGALNSPDHVRVLNGDREEIASQTTMVTSWEPSDASVKWLWVFFFADESETYFVEYGNDIRKSVETESPIVFKNNQRSNGYAEINTGPLRFRIEKGGSGFIDRVEFDDSADGFTEEDIIATGISERGSFLDLVNEGTFLDIISDSGIDTSRAVVHQQFIEKGSGPMHAIVRVEGEYEYSHKGHENSPFVTYIHAYAGKSFIKVLHTITYTGKPDRSSPLNGREHADIATQTELIVDESARSRDSGLTQPGDQIASMGIGMKFNIDNVQKVNTGLYDGNWWQDDLPYIEEFNIENEPGFSVFQTGPSPTRVPPVANSSGDDRITDGFTARVSADEVLWEKEKAEGWMNISDDRWGVAIGIKNMVKEYPNELSADFENNLLHAYSWSPNAAPMSFEREDTEQDGGMVGNFAQGITKTTESVIYFHGVNEGAEEVRRHLQFVLNPPAAHAEAEWYSDSGVYGSFASADNNFESLERSMQYKFDWMLFNQKWEPWYGAFEYGDLKNYYFGNQWYQWANNEPAVDYMWWTNYLRTGDAEMYRMAQASSRHSMDVDNTHWPTGPTYRGDTNSSLDYLSLADEPQGTPYLGMGRRHAGQQHISMLSAHVWITGWIASYYLDGYHRGLEVARLTGDYYVRRIFEEHGLTGRRLYLSVWNLSELYDATKDPVYLSELNDRIERVLRLQRTQGGRMIIDRYGYSQNYLSHGLTKYLQMFDRPDIEQALIRHARSIYDVAPLDHDMESYLSSIHMLITGYDLSGEEKYFNEACYRSRHLLVDPMDQSISEMGTQAAIAEALQEVSNLPSGGEGPSFRGRSPIWSIFNGMRIFGWTHAYNVPYMIDRLQNRDDVSLLPCVD